MVAAATVLLGGSLVGLCGLFGLKWYEHTHETTYAPQLRSALDDYARALKMQVLVLKESTKRFPALVLLISRYLIHVGAKAFARLAKRMERAAHDLADRVSHKHSFKRRAPRSQFLKQVIERNNGMQ
jgi:hypothetical protein